MQTLNQTEILLLAIEGARTRLYLARRAYDSAQVPKNKAAFADLVADAERLVEQLESLFLGRTLPKD